MLCRDRRETTSTGWMIESLSRIQDLQRLAEIETHIEKIVIVAIAIKGLINL